MSEPLLPHPSEPDAPGAAEPGPAAPGTPLTEEPDVLPDAAESDGDNVSTTSSDDARETDESGAPVVSDDNPPFRTPEPGARLSESDLEDPA